MPSRLRATVRSAARRVSRAASAFVASEATVPAVSTPAPVVAPPAPAEPAQKQGQKQGNPSRYGVRSEWQRDCAGDLTPDQVTNALALALAGDPSQQALLIRQIQDRDAHLVSVLGTRARAVSNLAWSIKPASESETDRQIAAWVEREIGQCRALRRGFLHLLQAVPTGYAGVEIAWGVRAGRVVPMELLYRPAEWFRPCADDPAVWHILSDRQPVEGEPLWPHHWIFHTAQARAGWAVEAGLGRCLLFLYLFWRYGVADWATYNEKYGAPLRFGTYPEGSSDDDIAAFDEALQQLGIDASAVFREGWKVDFKADAGNKTGGDTYQKLLEWLDRAKSKVVLGQTLTTEAGQTGTQALGTVQADVRRDIRDADAQELEDTLTGSLVASMVFLNFGPNVAVPRFCFDLQPPADQEVDGKIQESRARVFAAVQTLGVRVPLAQVREELGLRAPEAGEAVLGEQTPAAGATPGAPAPSAGAAATVADTAFNGAQVASMLQILAAVSAGTLSPAAAVVLITAAFPTVSVDKATAMVRGATAAGAAMPATALSAVELAELAPPCCGRGGRLVGAGRNVAATGVADAFDDVVQDASGPAQAAWRRLVSEMAAKLGAAPSGAVLAAIPGVLAALDTEELVLSLADATLRAEALGTIQARTGVVRPVLPAGRPSDAPEVAAWAAAVGMEPEGWIGLVERHMARAANTARAALLRVAEQLGAAAEAGTLPTAVAAEADRMVRVVDLTAGIAWGQGRTDQQQRERDRKPFLRYHTRQDDAVRPAHREMEGRIYAADHPIWEVWMPPNGFNCRCWVTAHTRAEVEAAGWTISEDWPTATEDDGDGPAEGVAITGAPVLPDPKFRRRFSRDEAPDLSRFPPAWRLALGVKDV